MNATRAALQAWNAALDCAVWLAGGPLSVISREDAAVQGLRSAPWARCTACLNAAFIVSGKKRVMRTKKKLQHRHDAAISKICDKKNYYLICLLASIQFTSQEAAHTHVPFCTRASPLVLTTVWQRCHEKQHFAKFKAVIGLELCTHRRLYCSYSLASCDYKIKN